MAFPTVPIAPGVPPIPRDPLAAAINVALLTADAVASFFLGGIDQWGIFLDGFPVVVSDSVVSFEYRQDWVISDYPQEQGAFESYDKVQTPFLVRVRFASGGSEFNRVQLLNSVAAIAGDTNFYDVVTPEAVYTSCNIGHYDYRRSNANGLGLLQVDVWLVEVRVTIITTFANTQSPSGAGTFDSGGVQTTAPAAAQVNSVFGAGNAPNTASGA